MFDDPQGPIRHFSWARFVIENQEHAESKREQTDIGKDIRLIGRKVTPWQERRGHRLKPSMITGIYDQDVQVLIIGTGVYNRLKCPNKVKQAILAQGISSIILQPTPEACCTYNLLFRQGVRVALLAHGTC